MKKTAIPCKHKPKHDPMVCAHCVFAPNCPAYHEFNKKMIKKMEKHEKR